LGNYDAVGYLWQGRYKSMIVDKERYLDRLGEYIERNALRSGLVKNPGQWKWSSYRFYAYGEPLKILVNNPNQEKVWVNLIDEDPLYKNLGLNLAERQKNYQRFIFGIDDEEIKSELALRENRGRPRKN
jgi:putative transposase